MRINSFLGGCASALLLTGALGGNAFAAAPGGLADHVRALCTHLKQQGWTAPRDFSGKAAPAEIDVPGVMYLCHLERALQGAGPGHSPLLQALISDDGTRPSVVFSADIWCDADRRALAVLAAQIDRQFAAIALPIPAASLASVRVGTKSDRRANGLHIGTAPLAIDAQACAKVPENGLGAVLMKIDVTIEPANSARR